ncbi:putative hexaprenyl pyrophosphate synthase, mitochondrial [Neolecta irregularis DAH-3]|uniref:Putative hexaprenyl pyrophosphate synthase, mitochondrial n=1 Tax=Neolecta irregularis (strain DAH-3) TaxID=1198029 RepID=A0A1U7LV32_NEOID|nr:putative hexaprenyl pyrophosphate synthase, mitochondrial [Neolecta irregularis DAH-3]|eukprot:OLL26530.1 putative hexaprenyl pyrophosphate synthase, mitochondrial [Neolecta irregularis DAH-3]
MTVRLSRYTMFIRSCSSAVMSSSPVIVTKTASNPFNLVHADLRHLESTISLLLQSTVPKLSQISNYYINNSGKRIRPTILLLLSKATSKSHLVSPSQRKLGEITEMIHAASLLHDDVIDNSSTRRNIPSTPTAFGNKMSILAGDYLLAQACILLASLNNTDVVKIMSTVIANLVEGEILQLSSRTTDFSIYLEKTYLKTASLISLASKAAMIVDSRSEEVIHAAEEFGKNLGIAFQLIDDMLDFSNFDLGKPSNADLKLGLATAPALFAYEEFPELGPLISRGFGEPGDVELATNLVLTSQGISKTKELARKYIDRAKIAISSFEGSPAKDGLDEICELVLNREK